MRSFRVIKEKDLQNMDSMNFLKNKNVNFINANEGSLKIGPVASPQVSSCQISAKLTIKRSY
jgi:hypothetical protein